MNKFYSLLFILFLTSQSQAQYCVSAATQPADEDIFNVTIQSINNNSACIGAGVGQNYSDFSASVAPAILWPGGTFTLSTSVGVCSNFGFSTSVAAFIDLNRNFSLTDGGEKVYSSPTFQNSVPTAVFTGNITIPLTATQGVTRLRVVAVETTSSAAISACGTYNWGETEDYSVLILPQPIANDMGMSVFNNPLPTECLTNNTSITVTVFNYGNNNQMNVPIHLVVTGANNVSQSAIIPGAFNSFTERTFTFTGVDLSNYGTNNIKVFTGLLTDGRATNDTITVVRTFAAPSPMPYSENFEAGGVPAGYAGNMTFNTAFGVMHGKAGSKGMFFNLWNGATSFSENLPKVGTLRNDAVFSFDYRIVNRTGYLNPGGVATKILSDDSLTLWMSSDCGTTFQHVKTITGINHIVSNQFQNVKILIKGKAGIDPVFRFTGKYSAGSGGDYFVDIDNINIYNDSNDFSISSLESPAGIRCFKGNTNVILKVTNNGTARQTNIPVYGQISGAVNPSFTMATMIRDTLDPGQSIDVNLGKIFTSLFGIVNCKFFTAFPYENNLLNDTMSADIYATEPVMIIPTDTIICKYKCTDLFALGSANPIWSDGQATILISACPIVNTNYWVATTDANNCPDTAYQKIKVNILPTVTTMDDSVCKGEFGTISASGALSYDWGSLGMNKKATDNPSMTTVYTVIGTNGSGCKDTNTATIYIKDLPNSSVSNDSICEGKPATLIASGGLWYNWGIYGNNPFINVNVTKTTKYPVEIIGANGCRKVEFATAYVRPKPTIYLNNPTVCVGTDAILNASGGVTYNWGKYGTQPSINITNVTSNQSIPLTVTDQYACTNTTNATITTKSAAPINTKDIVMCSGASANITANTYVTGAIYNWRDLGTGQTKAISPLSSTIYDVTATDPNGCDAIGQVKVTVKMKPNVRIDALPTTVCSDVRTLNLTATPTGGFFSGINVSFGTFYPKVGQEGRHMIFYTYNDESAIGCNGSDSFEVMVKNCKINTAIHSINGIESVTAYPNPFSQDVKLSLDLIENQTLQFNLIDAQGRILQFQNHDLTIGKHQIQFSTKDLSAGQYYIQVVKDNESIHIPVIKN